MKKEMVAHEREVRLAAHEKEVRLRSACFMEADGQSGDSASSQGMTYDVSGGGFGESLSIKDYIRLINKLPGKVFHEKAFCVRFCIKCVFRVHFPTLAGGDGKKVQKTLEGARFTVTELGQDVRKRNKTFFDEKVAEEQAAKKQRLDAVSSLQFASQLKDIVGPELIKRLVTIGLTRDDEAQKIVERGDAIKAQRSRGGSSAGSVSSAGKSARFNVGSGGESSRSEE